MNPTFVQWKQWRWPREPPSFPPSFCSYQKLALVNCSMYSCSSVKGARWTSPIVGNILPETPAQMKTVSKTHVHVPSTTVQDSSKLTSNDLERQSLWISDNMQNSPETATVTNLWLSAVLASILTFQVHLLFFQDSPLGLRNFLACR